jgi:hypothetical protein
MACTIQDIKRDSLAQAASIFKGKAKSITFKDNIATISYGTAYQVKTRESAIEMAKRKLAEVESWAAKKFGEPFRNGWGQVDTTIIDKVRVALTFPSNLYAAYQVKKSDFERDIDYYMGDEQLMQQEEDTFYQTENSIKPEVSELFESNPELANKVCEALGFNVIKESEITYTDEEGNLCAKMGSRSSKFTKGSKWEIVKDLKGYPSHAQGGVDIKIGKNGFNFTRDNGVIEAKHGLVLPKIK